MDHKDYMARALELAAQAAEHGDVPVGCVIVKDGKIVGEGRNRREEHGDATAHAELEAIRDADLILLGPGSLYTSVIPNLLVEGVPQAIAETDALKIYICNIMTQDGETEGMTASDHVKALLDHSGPGLVDLCLCNSAPVRPGLVERYREEDAAPIVVDRAAIEALGVEAVTRPLASETLNYARHSFTRLADAVMELYNERADTKIF